MSSDPFKTLLKKIDKGSPKKGNEPIELDNKRREQPARTNRMGSIEKSLLTLFNTGLYSKESMIAAIKSGTSPNISNGVNHTPQAVDVNHTQIVPQKTDIQEKFNSNGRDTNEKTQPRDATRKPLVEKTESKSTLLGLIKLYRKSLKNGGLRNHKLWTFLTYCFLKASHKKRTQKVGHQSVELKPGEFIFGRTKASAETKLSIQEIRTCLTKFKKAGNLTIKSTNKYSIVAICNWGDLL